MTVPEKLRMAGKLVELGVDILEAGFPIASQGDFPAARELLLSVLAASCREFGEEHPDSLTTMGNLAAVLWQQGDRGEAYALQQEVVELQRRARGEDDPATLAAAAVLETMECDPGY